MRGARAPLHASSDGLIDVRTTHRFVLVVVSDTTKPLMDPSDFADRKPSDDAVHTLQRIALLDGTARDAQVSGILTVCLITFVGLLLRDAAPETPFGWWMVPVIFAAAIRAGLSRLWRHSVSIPGSTSPRHRIPLARWEFAFAASALCTGLAWASVTLVTAQIQQVALPFTLILTIALILASTSPAGSGMAQMLFAFPVVVSQEYILVRHALADHGTRDLLLAFAWVALVVALFFVKRNASAMMRDSLMASIEHERRASEQATLLENLPLGILVLRDMRIAVCNDALIKLFGYPTKEDLIGRNIRALIPDDDAWREVVQYTAAALEGPVPPRVVRRLRFDGSTFEVMSKLAVLKTLAGQAEFIGIYENVQEQLAVEENYRHVLRMQRLVFETAGEGIAIVNDGLIEQANQALADLVGSPSSELVGRPLQTIFEDPSEWSEIDKHFQRIGNTLKLERRLSRSDGRGVWVNVTGRLVDAPSESDEQRATAGKRSIWILADLSMQKRKEAENWHHANHDMMTGLPNRRFLQDRLDQAIASARRDGRRVAAVELDLDGFKSVNDNYGHRFGDAVLEEVARRLTGVVRELDTVGRWGGDEFVLVLREIDSAEVVEETVKRVIARLSEPIVYMGQNLSVGTSIGIALFPDHGDDVETLMLMADLAMYESKGAGGNTWRFATPVSAAPRGKYRPAGPTQPA